ncbi:Gfo/Idh/MocA family oxidoreductase [Bacillus timonensis]|uniref:Gfo/Idh/MocA family oxidoreductase n=1 Tax=Bacillus timonensis TaxID=1033734 RepID=A0A4S3PRP4_9BACI|nr:MULTISPECIES: Gfo/Idh/MocA family oxidoreductase [Bacillus]MCC3355665.1 Gfo/Idh/MocA family oxidoreductase [Bacillus sp. REN16]THE12044.1 Gfo/Idh/MocA family oxidoreductase [Bacillus timonensis]
MVIRFGLVGCGYISKKHLHALSRFDDAHLHAVSDLDESRMDEARNFYQTQSGLTHPIKYFKDYEEMLADQQLDAVIISSFSGLHAEMAKKALQFNKHVILEKPMALSIDGSNELIALAQKQKKELMVCHQLRFRPIMQKIKGIIDDGKIGTIYLGVASIRINRSPDYFTSAPWRGKWETDGGMLINQGIHIIDLLQWFLGEVHSVYGEIGYQSTVKETEDVALGILDFKSRAKGIIEANIVTQPNNLGYSLSLFGEKGTICIEGPSLKNIGRWYIEGENTDMEELDSLLQDGNEEIYMYDNFIEAVKSENKGVLLDGTEGKKALEIIFGMYQSELSKQPVEFPIYSFSTSDMKERKWKSHESR